jgi:hypothetical protein
LEMVMRMAFPLLFSIVLVVATTGCIDPKDRRPGLRLGGDVVRDIPSDWGFTDEFKEVAIEVKTPYLLPHSVTISCAAADGRLYVAARNPDSKRWPGWVERNPDVRLGIGKNVYEVRLAPLDDSNQVDAARSAYSHKYNRPDARPEGGPPMRYWRVEPRG